MPIYKSNSKTKNGAVYFFKINYKNASGQYKQKRSKLFKTKAEAVNEETLFRSSIGKNEASNITFDQIYAHYIANKKNEVKIQTLPKIEQLYKYIHTNLGNAKIAKLSVFQYEQFKKSLDTIISKNKPLSTNYKNKIHRLVKSLIIFSNRYYSISNDVAERVGGYSDPNKLSRDMDFYTFEEYKSFRNKIEDLKWLCFFDTLYFCGLRMGEANALTWNDLDISGSISINKTVTSKVKGIESLISSPKTKAGVRTLPVPKRLLNEILELKAHYASFSDFQDSWYIFGGVRPLGETTITNTKNSITKTSNLKQIRIHDFRHSCASLLINNGANITIVAKYLGHSKIDMTLNTYSHMYKSKLEEITDLINELDIN